jgi:hypothetical protein
MSALRFTPELPGSAPEVEGSPQLPGHVENPGSSPEVCRFRGTRECLKTNENPDAHITRERARTPYGVGVPGKLPGCPRSTPEDAGSADARPHFRGSVGEGTDAPGPLDLPPGELSRRLDRVAKGKRRKRWRANR